MTKQTINVGTAPNSRTGDSLRTAFIKINENFDEVYNNIEILTGTTNSESVMDLNIRGSVYSDAGNLLVDAVNGKIVATALPNTTTNAYTFTARFDSAGDLLSVEGMPNGWTYTLSDNLVSVYHGTGEMPVTVTYWGFQDNGEMRLRFPTPGYPANVAPQDNFRIDLFLNTAATGATSNQYALINIVF